MKHIAVDNLDRLPQTTSAPDVAPWVQPSMRLTWQVVAVLCGFVMMMVLIGYWLLRDWFRYGSGSSWAIGTLTIVLIYLALMALRGVLLIEVRGYQMPVWDARYALDTLVKADIAYASREFANAAQVTYSPAAPQLPAPEYADDDDTIDGEVIDSGPQLIPDSDWLPWIDRTPHLLLAGRTDAGKTTFAEAILSERILSGDQIVICDPHYQPGKWHGIEATSDVEAILTLLARIEQDMAVRFTDFTAGKPTEDFQRLTILIDEVPAVVEETFRLTSSGTKRIVDDRWSRFARRLGSQARKVRISVILMSQTIFVEDLMINSAYRENFVRVGLGDKARPLLAEEKRNETKHQLYDLLRGQAHPAAFEHNGEIHLLDTSRVIALAARRNGHMAQLWLPPQIAPSPSPPARPVVSAHAAASATVSMSVPGAIVYPAVVKSTNGKIAFLLQQKYSYRQIERELSVSFTTISQVKKAMEARN